MPVEMELKSKPSTLGPKSPTYSFGQSSIHEPATPGEDTSALRRSFAEDTGQDAPKTAEEEAEPAKPSDAKNDFLVGWQLFLALTGVTVVMLLAMIDMAILGTVSTRHLFCSSFLRPRQSR